MKHEMTKIVYQKCEECGAEMSILCGISTSIVAARCPKCTEEFIKRNHRCTFIGEIAANDRQTIREADRYRGTKESAPA